MGEGPVYGLSFMSKSSTVLKVIQESIMSDEKEKPVTSSPLAAELINALVDSAADFTKVAAKAAVDKYTNRAANKVKKVTGALPQKKRAGAKKTAKKAAKKKAVKKAAKKGAKKAVKKKASKKKRL